MKQRIYQIAIAIVFSFLMLGTIAPNASADTGPNFDRSHTYWYSPCADSTWGGDAYHQQTLLFIPVAESRSTGTQGRVEAYANMAAVDSPIPQSITETCRVWKTVTCQQSGRYSTSVFGNYIINLMTYGGQAGCYAKIEYQIYHCGTGQVLASTQIFYESQYYIGFEHFEDDIMGAVLYWDAVAGTTYHLQIKLTTYAWGWGFTASFADAWNAEGVWIDEISVAPYYDGGGSGCVSGDTMVLMADGTELCASDIRAGDIVTTFDPITSQWSQETVLSVDKTNVKLTTVINDGLLRLTLDNQPIWARNDTYEGWIMDPIDLCIGWEIYSPVMDTWVEITGLSFVEGPCHVYDIHVSGPDTFIGNGILMDQKTI